MSAREQILRRVRTALGNPPVPAAPPPVLLDDTPAQDAVAMSTAALEKLAGKVYVADAEADASAYVRSVVDGRPTISTHPLAATTTTEIAAAAVGVTGAAYGLADTGSLVVLSSEEARLVSLLPPVHIAILKKQRLLSGLDELFTVIPRPADTNASMVLITGPSRTADIEQILVRGVHGPGELHVVLI